MVRKRGFTLIELLVVIAIIAILAAILFPVFARARENARKSTCTNNMKQIGTAIMQYVQDYDERYPGGAGMGLNGAWQPAWWVTIQPYVKNTGVLECPSHKNVQYNPYATSYGCNSTTVMFWGSGAKMASINNVAGTIAIGEKDGNDWPCYPSNAVDPGGAPWVPANKVDPRHSEGSLFAFCDGHAKWLKFGSDIAPENLWDNN